MSIITEALKKAEQERQKLKQLPTLQEINTVLAEEEKVVESFLEKKILKTEKIEPVKEPIKQNAAVVDFSKIFSFPLTEARKKTLIFGSLVLFCLVLYLVVNHSSMKNTFSFFSFLFKNSKTFQTASVGIVYDQETSAPGVFSGNFVLSGISVQGNDQYAVINGKILQKGDFIKGAYVKEILTKEVILETKTGELRLTVSS